MTAIKEQLRLSDQLASMDLPPRGEPVTDPFGLMMALVAGSTKDGIYYSEPMLLRRIAWWQDDWDNERVAGWLSELVEWGEITIEPRGRNCYSPDETFDCVVIQNKRRFARWKPRPTFTRAQRVTVYARDNGQCVYCGATENLSIDHIVPWSKGGEHTMDNFQTLCLPCNIRKSNN